MTKEKKETESHRVVATNRRALAKYEILESLEAGVVLTGAEVKSVRDGRINLGDGFVRIENGEAFLWNVHISPYTQQSTHVSVEPLRTRKVLLHRTEINRWMGKAQAKGLTVVPLEVYFGKRGVAKLRLGLAKGKTAPDRRDDIKRRTIQRELQRDFAGKHKIK